ncbi:MAG: 1-acyl-sn-glycerol-3-phosphate acyltransferase [Clostridia bacterium]|nr:1-acyl-sn-glycerol-3-phosphate acyltransferase [Clostridia bacterium]
MPYDPKRKEFPYSEFTDQHYMKVYKDDRTVFDKSYRYIDDSFRYRFFHGLLKAGLFAFGYASFIVVLGLKVRGRDNLKKHRKELKNTGFVTVSNHVHRLDYMAVQMNMEPRQMRILAWDKNMRGENKFIIRYTGGIPVPVNDFRATAAMAKAVREYLKAGGVLHVDAEGSMWEYYMPIRPFKPGAFYFAVKANVPVLPFAFSYRERKGIQKLLYRKGLFTLNIGEPLYPDKTLPQSEAIKKLTVETHREVCRLAGIDPDENIYPPIFNNNRRVDYY